MSKLSRNKRRATAFEMPIVEHTTKNPFVNTFYLFLTSLFMVFYVYAVYVAMFHF
jgi:hypothetical protein